jgi:hypothetical protein
MHCAGDRGRLLDRRMMFGAYGALCAALGIGSELVTEALGLGDDHSRTFFTQAHCALLLALAVLMVFASLAAVRTCHGRDGASLTRRIRMDLRGLPGQGSAGPCILTTTALTFFSGACAQVAEGSPLISHDAWSWTFVSLVFAVVVASIVSLVALALPVIVAAFFSIRRSDAAPRYAARDGAWSIRRLRGRWSDPCFARPPPAPALA